MHKLSRKRILKIFLELADGLENY